MTDTIYRQQRINTAQQLREKGIDPYSNRHIPQHVVSELVAAHSEKTGEELEVLDLSFSIAGRVMAIRSFGKAAFMKLKDRTGELQIFVQKTKMADTECDDVFKATEVGDFVFAEGHLFRTKTNEFTLRVNKLKMVTKAIEQLPEKYHGLTDVEARYRRRYVDLIANPEVKDVFIKRSKILTFIREFFEKRDFLEVETPMMQAIASGAKARPFVTRHNTLGMDLFLRIAPELYLKRLVVGGLERVFELNRNFRNEGISTQHNPEFTMLEFYMTYKTYRDLMELTEELTNMLSLKVCGAETILYQGQEISFKRPFARYTIDEAIKHFLNYTDDQINDRAFLLSECGKHGFAVRHADTCDLGVIKMVLFEDLVEAKLISPTFVTHYPTSASPLSRRNDDNPSVVDRFELFICGREIANAFSELNDPLDQRERFEQQMRERAAGDEEAMIQDDDFVKALEYGMPPTAGEGIGIDRLVMILVDVPSIRDVILFPSLRKE